MDKKKRLARPATVPIQFPVNRPPAAPPAETERLYCRAVILSAGREAMAYRADFKSLMLDKSNGHASFKTWHTQARVIAPVDSIVFILEPEDEAGQIEFQERDQLYP